MILRKWKALPSEMQCEEVKKYYDILKKKKGSLFFKRVFDFLLSSLLIVVLSPLFLCLALSIKIDSSGPVFFRQVRVTRYGETTRELPASENLSESTGWTRSVSSSTYGGEK